MLDRTSCLNYAEEADFYGLSVGSFILPFSFLCYFTSFSRLLLNHEEKQLLFEALEPFSLITGGLTQHFWLLRFCSGIALAYWSVTLQL